MSKQTDLERVKEHLEIQIREQREAALRAESRLGMLYELRDYIEVRLPVDKDG